MSAKDKRFNQCKEPSGWIGRFLLWTMNVGHSRLTDWGLGHVAIRKNDTILDIGCGGGRTIRKLAAAAPEGKVFGIDHSAQSVAASRRENRQTIDAGRVNVQQASVSHLPFADNAFDLITAVETHFFWPDLANDMREVLRTLEPGGTFVMIAEIYKGNKHDARNERAVRLLNMAYLSPDEHRELFTKAGYSDVRVETNPEKGWICCVGRKPGG